MALFEFKSAHSDNIALFSYLFSVCLRHAHSALSSNERSETKTFRFQFLLNIFEKFLTE